MVVFFDGRSDAENRDVLYYERIDVDALRSVHEQYHLEAPFHLYFA